jgi:hypothetical protein
MLISRGRKMEVTMRVTLLCALILCSRRAEAQTDFNGARLKIGDTVYVTTAAGAETNGIVASVSASQLTLAGLVFTPAETMKVQRRGDRIWNGLLIGGLAGGFAYLAGGSGESSNASLFLSGAALFGGLGALIDFENVGRTTVYRNPKAAISAVSAKPIRRGMLLTVALFGSPPR